ncbi:unnamed protein product [Eruca vesicaria subsp. sativa]|uniref:Histidine-containing phosphotransfer protein n=1 Tax=Eruca vesicaria subsp. sativa TaxID=29727 RepID=A0ABC8KWA6_ERUVS|nr:unnamed protein product [Eruca vesicaria subsp. sativa]
MDALVAQLQMQYRNYTVSLYQQGFLDERFTELRQLQDDKHPNFAAEMLSLSFDDSVKHIGNITRACKDQTGTVDFGLVDVSVHQLKCTSSSVGAKRVKDLCVTFKEYCEANNYEGCVRCLQQVDIEYNTLKTKLQDMFNLEKQIIQAGGKVPQVDGH